MRWEVLAAINEIETDYGRNLNVSYAGAQGWMQFMPATWKAYGTDANRDGRRDPYNPVDAIFAAARYLKAAGAETDLRTAIFAYNHADWYVADVLERAEEIAAMPTAMVGALTGLADGRFPVRGPAEYEGALDQRVGGREGAERREPRARRDRRRGARLHGHRGRAAGAGRQRQRRHRPAHDHERARTPHRARDRGQLRQPLQLLRHPPHEPRASTSPAARRARRSSSACGARRDVPGGTLLGRLGRDKPMLRFGIRPAGEDAPLVDPKPMLDGWRLLEQSAVYRPSGKSVLHPDDEEGALSIGQAILLPKSLLARRVLADSRILIYPCGRADIETGRIDRRVLALLAFLAESGMNPTVTSLQCGHGYYTASGNVSHHTTGTAVDIAAINGIPILGHQEAGGVTDRAVRAIMRLQGAMAPSQIISLLDYGGATFAMGDHHDHIHVGYQPGEDTGHGGAPSVGAATAILEASQWDEVVGRVGAIKNPRIREQIQWHDPANASCKYKRAMDAQGDAHADEAAHEPRRPGRLREAADRGRQARPRAAPVLRVRHSWHALGVPEAHAADIDRLYALPLEEFTRERDELAKRLRGDGDADAAAAVKALKKPSVAAWAVNQVQRDRPDEVRELIEVTEELHRVYEKLSSAGARERLEEAAEMQRKLIRSLVRCASQLLEAGGHSPSDATLGKVADTLRAAALDDELRDQLGRGRVVKEQRAAGLGPLG